MNLWVDDERLPAPGFQVAVVSSEGAIRWLDSARRGVIEIDTLSLDHDLGGDDTTRPIVLWMCASGWWPNRVLVHTANPVGREWLEGMIARYKP